MHKRYGFTLLELLLASVLLAVLMVGVMSVITNVVQPAEAVAQRDAEATPTDAAEAFADLVREELAQALTIELSSSAIQFTSFGGLDPQTHERTQRPVRVRYGIESIDGRAWVVRDEQAMDTQEQMPSRRELVVTGITRFELEVPPIVPSDDVMQTQTSPLRRDRNAAAVSHDQPDPPVDAVWRLCIWTDDLEAPAFERGLVLRRSLAK